MIKIWNTTLVADVKSLADTIFEAWMKKVKGHNNNNGNFVIFRCPNCMFFFTEKGRSSDFQFTHESYQ